MLLWSHDQFCCFIFCFGPHESCRTRFPRRGVVNHFIRGLRHFLGWTGSDVAYVFLIQVCKQLFPEIINLRKQPTFRDATSGFPAKWRQRNERRNSILVTRHDPDLFSTSDWSCREGMFLQPIRSTIQIWVVVRHQYGISALAPQWSFRGETSGGVASMRCLCLWHATHVLVKLPLAFPYYLYLEAKTANNEILCGFSSRSSVAFLSLRGCFSLLRCWHYFCRRKMFDTRLKV